MWNLSVWALPLVEPNLQTCQTDPSVTWFTRDFPFVVMGSPFQVIKLPFMGTVLVTCLHNMSEDTHKTDSCYKTCKYSMRGEKEGKELVPRVSPSHSSNSHHRPYSQFKRESFYWKYGLPEVASVYWSSGLFCPYKAIRKNVETSLPIGCSAGMERVYLILSMGLVEKVLTRLSNHIRNVILTDSSTSPWKGDILDK